MCICGHSICDFAFIRLGFVRLVLQIVMLINAQWSFLLGVLYRWGEGGEWCGESHAGCHRERWCSL